VFCIGNFYRLLLQAALLMRILLVQKDPSFLEWQLGEIEGHDIIAVKTPIEAFSVLENQPTWDALVTGLCFSSIIPQRNHVAETGIDVIRYSFGEGISISRRIIYTCLDHDPSILRILSEYAGRVEFWSKSDTFELIRQFKRMATIVPLVKSHIERKSLANVQMIAQAL